MKKRLFLVKLKEPKCEECSWAKMSIDGRIPLELDHINGKRSDNRIENLQVLTRKQHAKVHFDAVKEVDKLKKISPNSNMSRSFLTLANLSATCTALYNLTGEPRWTELNNQIEEIIVNQGSVAKRENKIVAFCE